MTSTQNLIVSQAQRLIPEVMGLYDRALSLEQSHTEALQKLGPGYRDSAQNLLHYLAVRQVDARQLQIALAALGLSSLGRMEASTLFTLSTVLFALHRLAGRDWKPAAKPPVDFDSGQMLLGRHAELLLGLPPASVSCELSSRCCWPKVTTCT
jgi:pyruvate kinase